MGCSVSQKEKSNIPEEIRKLEALTVYQRPENPDTLILHREQAFGNTESTVIGRIIDVAVDRSGRVFIADIQQQVIHVFNSNGRFLRQLGRSGKGPGEFVTLKWVQIQNDYLYAYDPNQQQVSVFSLNTLAVKNTISLAENRGNYQALDKAFPWINNLYVTNSHTFLAGFTISPVDDSKPWQNIDYKLLFYLLDKDGNISKKLLEVVQPHTAVGPLIDNVKVFFGRPAIVLSNNDNIYVSEESDHFLIKIHDPNGAYRRAFYYPHPTVPLTKKSASEGGITNTHFRHEFILKHMESIDLPQNWPVLTGMKIDDQDRLWISTTINNMKVYQWWVLDPDGKLIARFTWPRRKQIEVIKNGFMYTRETNRETGNRQIVRYRIEMN